MFGQAEVLHKDAEALAHDFDEGALTGPEAIAACERFGQIESIVAGLKARCAKRVRDTAIHNFHGEKDPAKFLAQLLGQRRGVLQDAIDIADALTQLPAVDEAVKSGSLSATQAKMICDAAAKNPAAEQRLLEIAPQGLHALQDACVKARAEVEDPETRKKRQQRARYLTMRTDSEGMLSGSFRLTPEIGGMLKAAIEAKQDAIFRRQRSEASRVPISGYAADALAELVLGVNLDPETLVATPDADAKTGGECRVHVVIDHDTLTAADPEPGGTCEIPGVGPVNAEWVRSILGDAFVTAVIKKGVDVTTVAHFGRHIPAEIQTALVVRGRECAIEGCECRGYLERDHEIEVRERGPTALWNLDWLCRPHHKLKTLGWKLGPKNPNTGKRRLLQPD